MEDQQGHKDDIEKYVHDKLRRIRSPLIQEIKLEICKRSSGIFLWVVLVLHILRREFDHGRTHEVRKRLAEIPKGLDDLFDDIITRDTYNTENLVSCLRWVLFAARPLKPVELLYAVTAGAKPDSAPGTDSQDLDRQDLANFILSTSKGLVELTHTEPKRVQFIHETVRGYLFRSTSFQRIQKGATSNFEGDCQERLKEQCLQEIRDSTPNVPSPRQDLSTKDAEILFQCRPLLAYAVRTVIYHADAAAGHGVDQEAFIGKFPYEKWISLYQATSPSIDQPYTSKPSPLYIFTSEDALNLIKIEAKRCKHLDIRGGYYCYPLNLALKRRSNKAVDALLGAVDEVATDSGAIHGDAVVLTSQRRMDLLLDFSSQRNFDRKQTPLLNAAVTGHWEAAKILLGSGKIGADFEDGLKQAPFFHAASKGHFKLVELLLETGTVDVGRRDDTGKTPLSVASEKGHADIVELLLRTGKVDVDGRDSAGQTPLSIASLNGHADVVKLLLRTGKVDVDSGDERGWTPLLNAAEGGHTRVARLLLDTGKANVESRDRQGSTPLQLAAQGGHTGTVRILVVHGQANIETK